MRVPLPRDVKIRLAVIVLLAFVLAVPGFFYLYRQSAKAAVQAREVEAARRDQLAGEVQTIAEDATLDEAGRNSALRSVSLPGAEGMPVGDFVWLPRRGLVSTNGVPESVMRTLAGRTFLKDWVEPGRGSAKRPPRRGSFAVASEADEWWVFWARGTVADSQIYGVVFAGNPTEGGEMLSVWPLAGLLLLMFLVMLASVAWMLAYEVAKTRAEDRQKTSFMSNVSHELKTPLAAIGTWSWLLQQGRMAGRPEKIQHAYDLIVEENARMVRLVESLLEFSRLERGTRKYCIEEVDVARLASMEVELMRGSFEQHGIELHSEGECPALADVDAVKQILVNLLGNAAKYAAAEGKVEVGVTKTDDRVLVSVSDRGPGLSPDEMARVFDRFYRADSKLSSSTGGLGIGLAISRALAHDLKGKLTVAARRGGGCVFTLSLPASLGGGAAHQ